MSDSVWIKPRDAESYADKVEIFDNIEVGDALMMQRDYSPGEDEWIGFDVVSRETLGDRVVWIAEAGDPFDVEVWLVVDPDRSGDRIHALKSASVDWRWGEIRLVKD